MSGITPKYRWVRDNQALATLCAELRSHTLIALDTEFIRTNTFYPKLALLQLATKDHIFLIDPLSIDAFQPLCEILTNENITKILHSCSEDLEVCNVFFGVLPSPIFDTQVAAAVASMGFSLSYSALVQNIIGVDLPKGETRSDWLARPLTDEQEHYAALDVAYLIQIHNDIKESLLESKKIDWLEEDCTQIILAAGVEQDPKDYYQKIKSAWKLNPTQLKALIALVTWREIKAREWDKPRNHVVHEKVIFEAAKNLADSSVKVKQLMVGQMGRYRRQADAVAEIVQKILLEEDNTFYEKVPGPLPSQTKPLIKSIKSIAELAAESEKIPVEILLKKADIEQFFRTGLQSGEFSLPPRLRGWRKEVIGDKMLALVKSEWLGNRDQS